MKQTPLFSIKFISCFLFAAFHVGAFCQNTGTVRGKITDSKTSQSIESVNVIVANSSLGTVTDKSGNFRIQIPASQEIILIFSHLNYKADSLRLSMKPSETRDVKIALLSSSTELPTIVVEDIRQRESGIYRINPKFATSLPSAAGGIESLLKLQGGVVANNELSSQFSVRGGSFDENLVYVNDIEIFRPFLVSSGQQEGLSFVNSDLASLVNFSAGGFDAKFGDKMASVLDIKYKQPQEFAASASASLLGASVHVEDRPNNGRFSYLAGARYKTNAYLVKTFDVEGDYKPNFFDFQTLLSYKINDKLDISFLGYLARNSYNLTPSVQNTTFGTNTNPLNLTIFFEGGEKDCYNGQLGALTLTQKASENLQIKWIVSSYAATESVSYDIQGDYILQAVLEDVPKDLWETLGVGSYLRHARNNLEMNVSNIENRYNYSWGNHSFAQWGIKYQHERIDDKINEWYLFDSAGYVLPNHTGIPGDSGNISNLELAYYLNSKIKLNSNRYSAFAQNTWNFETANSANFSLTVGGRVQYWDYTQQLLFSPRAAISYKPSWKTDILFRFSAGHYFQPPFYRELRLPDGSLNSDIKAQESIHFVAGSDLNFKLLSRPFKFVTEIYYKDFSHLIPYTIDNVQILYSGRNNSNGYAAGIDLKLNGEFVPGSESWISLSFMRTGENIYDDHYTNYTYQPGNQPYLPPVLPNNGLIDSTYVTPGAVPRPNDQFFTLGIFFQDYLPGNPSWKVNMGLYFGSGQPIYAPNFPKTSDPVRFPWYRRVDVGMSKQIVGYEPTKSSNRVLKHFKALWITGEVLNLFGFRNVASYNWVKDFQGRQYGVPNYLTSRQLNIKLIAEF